MKSISEIQTEINGIDGILIANSKLKSNNSEKLKPAKVKALKKRKDYLKLCIAYLQTNPSQEFVESEKARIENRITLIDKSFTKTTKDFGLYSLYQKAKKEHRKIMEVPKLQMQLKTIDFIL